SLRRALCARRDEWAAVADLRVGIRGRSGATEQIEVGANVDGDVTGEIALRAALIDSAVADLRVRTESGASPQLYVAPSGHFYRSAEIPLHAVVIAAMADLRVSAARFFSSE